MRNGEPAIVLKVLQVVVWGAPKGTPQGLADHRMVALGALVWVDLWIVRPVDVHLVSLGAERHLAEVIKRRAQCQCRCHAITSLGGWIARW